MLKNDYTPVAIDQAYQRRQKDAEGELYRKIAGQGPRDIGGTTQGFYAASNTGELFFFNNNRNPDRLAGLLKKALADHESRVVEAAPKTESVDRRYNPQPPEGGLIVRVRAKVMGGYPETDDEFRKIFNSSLSRDNLWVSQTEHEALVRGEIPEALQLRIARFHLVDNTRGEPPMWRADEIESTEMKIRSGVLTGSAKLKTQSGDREFDVDFYGAIESSEGKITRFDIVASGLFMGHGRYTKNPPPGRFPLAISFEIADGSDVADGIPPQGSRGWVDGYIRQ